MEKIIKTAEEFDLINHTIEKMPIAKKILMVHPTYFDVEYSINPHMKDKFGNLNKINKERAIEQWNGLKACYENLGCEVSTIEGVPKLPDMVFCANQTFPYLDRQGNKALVLSNMHSNIRQKEVTHIANFFKRQNYSISMLAPRDDKHFFESTGDALWIPGLRFILGGYGFRTNAQMYELLSKKVGVPVAIFNLTQPRFYHLDTCLSILSDNSALYCPDAFDSEGIELLQRIFPNLIEVSLKEADSPGFACNAHSPDQKHVILQKGSPITNEKLVQKGFFPIEVDTDEFIKSGGSVFCMKLMFF